MSQAARAAEVARDLAEVGEFPAVEAGQVLEAARGFQEEISGIRVPDRVLVLGQHPVLAEGSTVREPV